MRWAVGAVIAGVAAVLAAIVTGGGDVRFVIAPVTLELSGAPLALRIVFTP
jgi:hypothetical protein